MVHRNASISNETISREQTVAKLRKLARICKWATICITTALALGLLAVIAIDLLLILPGLSQGSCLQSVELQAGEGPCLLSSVPMRRPHLCSSHTMATLP